MANSKKFYSVFRFVGELATPKNADKLTQETTFDSGWKKKSLKIGVKESQANSEWVNLDAMIPPTQGYEMSKPHKDGSGKKVTYKYTDRNSSAVLDNVADFAKITVDMETDFEKKKERIALQMKVRNLLNKETMTDDDKQKLSEYRVELEAKSDNIHKFVNEIDVIDFIIENLETFKAHKVRVTGNYNKTTSKGKYYTSYQPNTIELVAADVKNELSVSVDVFFDKDAIDMVDFKTDKKMTVNGYIKGYDNVAKEDKYYPLQFVVDASKLDLEENEKHIGLFNLIKSTYTVKGKNVHHIATNINVYNGSEMVEFTMDNLTEFQRNQVLFADRKLEDYAPRGGFLLGDRVQELKFAGFDRSATDGAEDTEITISEFEDMIATSSAETVKLADVKKPAKEEKAEEATEEETDDLFGGLFG